MLGIGGIVRIFEEIEQRLVQSLRRNLNRHKDEEKQYEKDWSAWQAEKLHSLERFRKENAGIMAEFTEQIDDSTREIMQQEFAQGVNGADVPEAVPIEGTPAVAKPEPQFFGVDDTKVNKLIEDVTTLEKQAETAALRLTDDVYRQTVNRVQLAMSTGSMTLQQAIDTAVKDFLNQGINCIVYRDGRRVNIADYVRMVLRTTATRAALQGKSAKVKALGYDTVIVSSYGKCSPTCEPWQGRPYIEDAFSDWEGETETRSDGIRWGKSVYCGKWFPLLSSAIEHGLFHPNCRHSFNLWRDGDPLPESIDNTDSERRYKLEQQQRELERAVRKAKRKVAGSSDPENVRRAKAELKKAQKKLKDFIDEVNAKEGKTVLKRDYGRETVYEGEVTPPENAPADVKVSTPEKAVEAPEVKPAESAPKADIEIAPENVPEPPVSEPAAPESEAVEVKISEPETPDGAYTEVKIPEQNTGASAPKAEIDSVNVPPPDDKSQSYRPVVLDESDEVTTTRDYEVKAHKAENTQNEVYVSENVDIKPKKLHQIDRHISEAIDRMGISETDNLPKVLVVSREDIAKTDIALYRAIENLLLICEDFAVYKPQDMPVVMKQLACGENDLSSYIHELYHWVDAEEFRRKNGAVTEEKYDEYINFINSKAKKRLDKLADKGYNILVSTYARDKVIFQQFYEIYTEFRTFSLLGGE